MLVAAGCGALQGYRFGRPMTPIEAKAMLTAAKLESKSTQTEPKADGAFSLRR